MEASSSRLLRREGGGLEKEVAKAGGGGLEKEAASLIIILLWSGGQGNDLRPLYHCEGIKLTVCSLGKIADDISNVTDHSLGCCTHLVARATLEFLSIAHQKKLPLALNNQ